MGKFQSIRVRNLETGAIRNAGPNFLKEQAKPYLGAKKVYADGVWVAAPSVPNSPESAGVISEAEKAAIEAAKAAETGEPVVSEPVVSEPVVSEPVVEAPSVPNPPESAGVISEVPGADLTNEGDGQV